MIDPKALRRLKRTHRGVTVTRTCPQCGESLGATFMLLKSDPDPVVIFRCLGVIDESGIARHQVMLTGQSDAARALDNLAEIGRLDASSRPSSDNVLEPLEWLERPEEHRVN